ncbi:hypothetical protein BH09PSE5_BH09PSE5_24540 [soil metagenome]
MTQDSLDIPDVSNRSDITLTDRSPLSASHAKIYSCWASATAASVCVAWLLDLASDSMPWAQPTPDEHTLGLGTAICFTLLSLGLLGTVWRPGSSNEPRRALICHALTVTGVIFGVLGWFRLDNSAHQAICLVSPQLGECLVSGIGAASAACIAVTSWSVAAIERFWRRLPALATLGVGYLMLVGYLYGARWSGMLPVGCMLILASTAVLALVPLSASGPARSGRPAQCKRRFALHGTLAAIFFPIVAGVAWGLDPDDSGASRFVMAAVISASLTAALSAILAWMYPNPSSMDLDGDDAEVARQSLLDAQLDLADERRGRANAESTNRGRVQFLARVSHELRTPLTSMLGYAQLLELDAADPLSSNQRIKLMHVERAGQHLQLLIDDLLDLTRIDAGQISVRLGTVPLHSVLDEVVQMMMPLADAKGIRLEAPVVDSGLVVWADELRLKQVLVNLLSNALKYNVRGGLVDVTVKLAPTEGERRPMLHVSVRDTGHGISGANLPHLFEPFNRLGQETSGIEGTGLGLALSKALARLMQGDIEAHSQLAVGTEMILKLHYQPK